jgi:hypothetical protein
MTTSEPEPRRDVPPDADARPTTSVPQDAGTTTTYDPAPGTRRGARTGGVRVLAILVIVAGLILIVAGAVTYGVVTKTLADQKITVSDDADHFAGQMVNTPWEAYAQASVINKHAMEASGGKTYAELPQDDPKRSTVMTASFLQASLFTSVVAFGVAALVVGLGIVLILIALALLRLSRAVRTA